MQDLDPSDICKKHFLNPLKRIRVIIRTPTHGRTDGRTDRQRQTDGRTGWIQYTPPKLHFGGYNNSHYGYTPSELPGDINDDATGTHRSRKQMLQPEKSFIINQSICSKILTTGISYLTSLNFFLPFPLHSNGQYNNVFQNIKMRVDYNQGQLSQLFITHN